MLRLHVEPYGTPSPRKIGKAAQLVRDGGVIAYPTDSVYALGCALDARKAIQRIYRAKQMNKHQRLALMCPDLSTAAGYGHFSQGAFRLAQRIFPGPYTLVVPATREVPRMLLDKRTRQVGIRIPDHPVVHALLAELDGPLLTSSAIPPGAEEACRHPEDVIDAFANDLDGILECEETDPRPSTVLEVDGEEVRVLREGAGPIDDLAP